MVRSRMRYRAIIQRDNNVDDYYGSSGAPSWQNHLIDQPCHAYNKNASSAGGTNYNSEIVPAANYYPVMMVPLDTDIKETDRVFEIKDKRGNSIFGLMDIVAVVKRIDHIEVRMKDHA